MANGDDLKEFPNVSVKLAAPKKQSAYEKERQIQEAKRQREEAETALALREFEEEFAGPSADSDDPYSARTYRDGPPGFSHGYGSYIDRFGGPPAAQRSGPGSLGPLSGAPPPPPGQRKRRALDEMREAEEARRDQDRSRNPNFGRQKQDQREPAVTEHVSLPKPTLRLTSLPVNVSHNTIMGLLKPYVEVYSVDISQPDGYALGARHACTAIVTLESAVTSQAIDTALTALKGRYLGCGHYLSIAKHLSSAALLNSAPTALTGTSEEPFAARKPREEYSRGGLRNAPPPSHFAPPESYSAQAPAVQPAGAVVAVSTSLPTEALKTVHVLVDTLLSEPDTTRAAAIEAMLMRQEEIQMDERFAFLYDSRSPAGVYYRYLLWRPPGISERRGRLDRPDDRLFSDVPLAWSPAQPSLSYTGVTSLGQVMDHADYDTDEEESGDEEGGNETTPAVTDEYLHLTPTQQARLAWLLASLPTSIGLLQKSEVAAITKFAITYATQGANEIVDMLLLNVDSPFSSTLYPTNGQRSPSSDQDMPMSDDDLPRSGIGASHGESSTSGRKDADDPSDARLIGLYLISDILMNASTARVKGAWKYRTLLETGLQAQGTFERLSQLDKALGWGKMRADKWKKKVLYVLGVWEGHSLFKEEIHAQLRQYFSASQPTAEERESKPGADSSQTRAPPKARFIKVGSAASPSSSHVSSPAPPSAAAREEVVDQSMPDTDSVEGTPMVDVKETTEDLDGIPMADLDGTPMEDLDGIPMGDLDGTPMDIGQTIGDQGKKPAYHLTTASRGTGKSRHEGHGEDEFDTTEAAQGTGFSVDAKDRAGAEDMFAQSDED